MKKSLIKISAYILCFIGILSVIIFLGSIPDYIPNEKYYSSPEEVIENSLQSTDYVVVTQNETAFVSCVTDVNDKNCQYIIKDDNGWKLITLEVFDNAYFFETYEEHGYVLCAREYNDKYMFYLKQKISHIEENGKINLTDSLNSSFEEFDHKLLFDYHFWYWCLDELPDDYTISINGEVVFEKDPVKQWLYDWVFKRLRDRPFPTFPRQSEQSVDSSLK